METEKQRNNLSVGNVLAENPHCGLVDAEAHETGGVLGPDIWAKEGEIVEHDLEAHDEDLQTEKLGVMRSRPLRWRQLLRGLTWSSISWHMKKKFLKLTPKKCLDSKCIQTKHTLQTIMIKIPARGWRFQNGSSLVVQREIYEDKLTNVERARELTRRTSI